MFKTYTSATISQAAVGTDPDLKNAFGNTYVDCTFTGTHTQVNYAYASFDADCVFTACTFEACNFSSINPAGGGLDPLDTAADFTSCRTGTLPIVGRRAPTRLFGDSISMTNPSGATLLVGGSFFNEFQGSI